MNMSGLSSENNDWFEVTEKDWLPPKRGKKLRLLADANVPEPVLRELKAEHIDVATQLEKPLHGREDVDVLLQAQGAKRVLLTMDTDFWDEKKHPIHQVRGVIILAVAPSDIDSALRAFGLAYGCFARNYPLNWWRGVKIRATPQSFYLRARSWEGRTTTYEMRLNASHRLIAREVT